MSHHRKELRGAPKPRGPSPWPICPVCKFVTGVNRHFSKLETEVTIPKVKLSSATKVKAIRKYFEELTATPNEKLYCQVCFCIKHEKRFYVEQHVETGKHQEGIEKRNIFVWSYKVIFKKNKSYYQVFWVIKMVLVMSKDLYSLYRSGGRCKGSCLGCSQVYQCSPVRTSKACPPGHTSSSSMQNYKIIRYHFCSFHFFNPCFSWLCRFDPSRFMAKPSLNHVSVIKLVRLGDSETPALLSLVTQFTSSQTFSFCDPF